MAIKTKSLRAGFWQFLLCLLAGIFCSVIIPYIGFSLSVSFHFATYADYSETQAKKLTPIIAAAPDLSEVQLPVGFQYVWLDKNYQLLGSSLEGDALEDAIFYAKTGIVNQNLKIQYQFITREEDYIILQYYIGSQFSNQWMNEHLPSPETLLLLFIGINCIGTCVFLTTSFAKKLRLQLQPFFHATAKISTQNLDFHVGHSKIKEFEDVLLSFSDMKDSLKMSLEQQWKAEQQQREQIAALAHDLKTPLTIIQGNADLMCETSLNPEQQQYADYILNSSSQMELYIKTLIDISRASEGYALNLEEINFSEYTKHLKQQILIMCETKELHLQMETDNIPTTIKADRLLLERAIMNVIHNGLEYSPEKGTLYVKVSGAENEVQITITDEGCGFSPDALFHAQEKFYMADSSRNSKLHFGMGLYIAKSIVEQHKGRLVLENSVNDGGGKVSIFLP